MTSGADNNAGRVTGRMRILRSTPEGEPDMQYG